jgi:hypothetical protein
MIPSVNEGSSCEIQFTVTDYLGKVVPVINIATATMSLFDFDSGTYIVSGVDIKSSINSSGVCLYHINGIYNGLVDQDNTTEQRVVYVAISGNAISAPEIREEFFYTINNMAKI